MGIERIQPIDLTVSVRELLDNYSREVQESVDKAVQTAGKQALKSVKQRSPVKTGTYKKGWRLKKQKSGAQKDKHSITIYNASKPYLTQLLENGHQKAGGGRVEGIPHIRPAYQEAQTLLEQLAREAIEEATGG